VKGQAQVEARGQEQGREDRVIRAPHSAETERAVLGALLVLGSIERVSSILKAEMFFAAGHRRIYEAMEALTEIGEPIDFISLARALEIHDCLETVGGRLYLVGLADAVPTTANLEFHAKAVRRDWVRRELMRDAVKQKTQALNCGDDELQDFLNKRAATLCEFSAKALGGGAGGTEDQVGRWLDLIDRRFEKQGELLGVASGFIDVDKITHGFQPGQLVIIFGRPGMCKTDVATSIAANIALRGPSTDYVAFFSLEMSETEIVDRLACAYTPVQKERLKLGQLDKDDFDEIHLFADRLSRSKLEIIAEGVYTVPDVEAAIRRMTARDRKPCVAIIDYLQIMKGERRENRQVEVAEIAKDLKDLAKRLKIPVIALAQASRACEDRQDKRPLLSDLRESGDLENNADMAIAIYRDEYYYEDTPRKGIVELIFRKNRDGAPGTAYLRYDPSRAFLGDWDPALPVPEPHREKPAPKKRRGKGNAGADYATADDD